MKPRGQYDEAGVSIDRQARVPCARKDLQQLLAKRGFDVGKIDGVIGASSRDAIRAMQVKYGLPADGYPSEELLSRLRGG